MMKKVMFLVMMLSVSIFAAHDITLGSSVEGTLTENSNIEYYTFTLNEQTHVLINSESELSDVLRLWDTQYNLIKEGSTYIYPDDKYSLRLVVVLEPGTYTISISLYDGASDHQSGNFLLSLEKVNEIATHPISLNSIVESALTSESGISIEESRYTEYYTFTLSQRTNIVISLGSEFSSKLRLYDSQNNLIKSASKFTHFYDSTVDKTVKRLVAVLEVGTYIINVTSRYSGHQVGDFSLILKENNKIKMHSISLNSTSEGVWTEESGFSIAEARAKEYYIFTLNEQRKVAINLYSAHNERLRLYDSQNNLIKGGDIYRNNDGQFNSRLVRVLEAGTYTIDVSILSKRQIGDFTLSLHENNTISRHPISLNSIIEGAWTEDSGLSIENARSKEYYTFTLNEKRNVVISLDSDLNGKIRLYDSQNNQLNGAKQWYGETAVVAVILEAGVYTIDVTTKDDGEYDLGDFTLELKDNNERVTHPITLNSTVDGTWTEESELSTITGRAKENYTFTLSKKTNIVITLESEFYDQLYLYDSQNNLIKNTESAAYNTSFMVLLDAGTYFIDTSTNRRDEFGNFKLTLKEMSLLIDPIHLNSTINGTWPNESHVSYSGIHSFAKYYTFTLAEKKKVTIVLSSDGSDSHTKLFLLNNHGNVIASQNFNSDIEIMLDAGTYKIEVTKQDFYYFENSGGGKFTLEINSSSLPTSKYTYLIPIYGLLLQ